MSEKKQRLGRGLDALLVTGVNEVTEGDKLLVLPIDSIKPGVYQPRSQIDDESLQELADSIRMQGVIQPIIVREFGLDEYELVAGERRWRASKMAGLSEIPAVIKNISDENALAIGLIENIQRQNLNPIEEARGLERLIKEFGLTHERVAEAVGRGRSSITNSLRLLTLQEPVQELLFHRRLEMGHARALVTLKGLDQVTMAQKAVEQGWSVREVERRCQKFHQAKDKPAKTPDNDILYLQQRLSEQIGMEVKVYCGSKGRGKISFNFVSIDELDYLLKKLGYQRED